MPHRPLAIGLWLSLAVSAPGQALANNAGFGGIYRTVDLGTLTGNDMHLGCADLGGRTWVTARDPAKGGHHVLYAIDANGALVSTLPQPAIHQLSAFGMRDLCTDGQNLAGGSEAGISILTPTGALATTWNGRPIAQPIAGPVLAALGVPRGLAWDGQAGNGAGRFYAVNFASPIYEFDVLGNITGTFPNRGWNGCGLALDAHTGNLWIDACPARGDLAEIDRAGGTWQPTGRRIPRARAGSFEGGLSEAAPRAGTHAPWDCTFALVGICQGGTDTLAVQRVDLVPALRGDDEVRLDTAINGSALDGTTKEFGVLDTVTLENHDASGAAAGRPYWTIVNYPPESSLDDLTDISLLGTGIAIAPEHRTLNELSIAHPSLTPMVFVGVAGAPTSLFIAPSLAVPPGFLVRLQSVTFDPQWPSSIASTNEVYLVGGQPQTGILVEAIGPNSNATSAQRGFWRIEHCGGRAAIRAVQFDWATSTEPGQESMVFDVDQVTDGRRHDAGNAAGSACRGTYRLGTDVATGLDYTYPQNHRAPCAGPGESAGFTIDLGDAGAARILTYHFAGGLFTAGKRLEFDCDTDGGLGVSGDAMRGLRVRVDFVDNTLVYGTLAVDPRQPQRAFVRL